MNPIRQWLRDARKEFGSPDEMKAGVAAVRCENTRKLLEREAVEWGLEELRKTPARSAAHKNAARRPA